jgi:acetylglutamate/LysW-gamma-L-alpha-aminoadipate kinase
MRVLKIGGSLLRNMNSLIEDVASNSGDLIVVHGGGNEVNEIAGKLGKEQRFIISPTGFKSRYTDRETMEIFQMVLAGKVNKNIVVMLQKKGTNAVGVSGMDGGLLIAKRKITRSVENGKEKIIRDDYTGKIESVNGKILQILLANNYVPVVAPIAISREGEPLNVDGDRTAAAIASETKAKELILMTDVDGFYSNFPKGLVKSLDYSELDGCIEKAEGGMKRKLVAAKEALEGGVEMVIIANGSKKNPILNALKGEGTIIRK